MAALARDHLGEEDSVQVQMRNRVNLHGLINHFVSKLERLKPAHYTSVIYQYGDGTEGASCSSCTRYDRLLVGDVTVDGAYLLGFDPCSEALLLSGL